MWAELRHEYEDYWGLEVVGERDGRRAVFFGDGIEAPAGGERAAATERLARARLTVVSEWRRLDGGWDADVS